LAGVAACVLVVAGSRSPAEGAATADPLTFEVNTTEDYINNVDVDPGDGVCATALGDCTLRAAVLETNALPGPQVVGLPAGEYVLKRAGCCEDASSVGDLDITDDLTIVGAGAEASLITEESGLGGVERVFDVREEAIVSITGLTVHDVKMTAILPSEEDCGGGVRNDGALTLSHVAVRKNTFRRMGGGICNRGGTLRVRDSVVAGNHAALIGGGGGILNLGYASLDRVTVRANMTDSFGGGGILNGGVMIVKDSTISGNFAVADSHRGAGGIENAVWDETIPSLVVINSSISGNFTDGWRGAGGISNRAGATAEIISSTITQNESDRLVPAAGGLSVEDGSTTTIINTIVAGNENGDCRAEPDSALPTSLGHNLDEDGTCGLSEPGDVSGANPYLGPLADNGGPTMTHAILTVGSPAVDGGDGEYCPAADQRGAPRPVDGDGSGSAQCDIGAFEYRGVVPPPGPEARGDADCDSAVTVLDELYALRHLALGEALPACAGTADVDCSGDVDDLDALFILYHVAALPVAACEDVIVH
jgi:hypothetical protein